MGLFDSLLRSATKAVSDAVGDTISNAIKGSAAQTAQTAAACTMPAAPSDVNSKGAFDTGVYTFLLPEYVWEVHSGADEVELSFDVAFDEDNAGELECASIYVGQDEVKTQRDIMKNFVRVAVEGSPVFFEKVTYHTEAHKYQGISQVIPGSEYVVYRFNKGGVVKNVSLSIPSNCPEQEKEYARKAFDMFAASFRVN